MKTKIFISGVLFFGIAAFVASAWRSLPDNHSAALHEEVSNAVLVSQNEKPSGSLPDSIAESSPNPVKKESLKETRSGLTVEIRSYDLNLDYPTVTVCADLPSVADWLPRFSAIYKDQPVDVNTWMLIDPDTAYQAANRCYLVMLPAGVFGTNPSGKLVFSLDYFEMSLPEKLPVDIIKKAKETLAALGTGIDFEVQDIPHGQSLIITKKPDSISQEDALQAVQKAIESATDKVYGPWTFTINLSQK
jgi:hypothetical protein